MRASVSIGMEPRLKVGDYVAVFTQGAMLYHQVLYREGIPRSSPTTINFGAVAANGTVAKALALAMQMDENQLLQARLTPLDDIEIVPWELQSQGRFALRNIQARVSLFTKEHDPDLETTEMFVMGSQRDLYLEIRNPTGYALGQSRVAFWGHRYILTNPSKEKPPVVTYVMAEGRAA